MYLNASNTFGQLNCTSKSTINIPRVVLLLQTIKKSLADQSVLPLGLQPITVPVLSHDALAAGSQISSLV